MNAARGVTPDLLAAWRAFYAAGGGGVVTESRRLGAAGFDRAAIEQARVIALELALWGTDISVPGKQLVERQERWVRWTGL